MADLFETDPSALLCDEQSRDLCFDDDPATPLVGSSDPDPGGLGSGSGPDPMVRVPGLGEEHFGFMVEREREFLPKGDYLGRLRSGELDFNARREGFDWIWKAHAHYSFGSSTFCLAMNFMDRFLSLRELPKGTAWAVQLLAVACLSIAAKIEETNVPLSIEFQVGEPKFVFEAKTIQRMELLVLDTLKWRMNALTPLSFLDFFLNQISGDTPLSTSLVNRSMQIICNSLRGIDFLEFRPSEIAAAVAISVSVDIQTSDIDKLISSFINLDKGRLERCMELIKDMNLISRSQSMPPHSPIGVLDAMCFSFKTDDSTSPFVIGSCPNSSHNSSTSPDTKRKKLDHHTTTSSSSSG